MYKSLIICKDICIFVSVQGGNICKLFSKQSVQNLSQKVLWPPDYVPILQILFVKLPHYGVNIFVYQPQNQVVGFVEWHHNRVLRFSARSKICHSILRLFYKYVQILFVKQPHNWVKFLSPDFEAILQMSVFVGKIQIHTIGSFHSLPNEESSAELQSASLKKLEDENKVRV